jgi:hypothetical protein
MLLKKTELCFAVLIPVLTSSISVSWNLGRPKQCPGKLPQSRTQFLTVPAKSKLDCAVKCTGNKQCSFFHYKDKKCQLYSIIADKDCKGFLTGCSLPNSGCYETQRGQVGDRTESRSLEMRLDTSSHLKPGYNHHAGPENRPKCKHYLRHPRVTVARQTDWALFTLGLSLAKSAPICTGKKVANHSPWIPRGKQI